MAKVWFKLTDPESNWSRISLEEIQLVDDIKEGIKIKMSNKLGSYDAADLIVGATKVVDDCYGPPALYTFPTPYAFPTNTYLMPLSPLPYLVHVPLFKSPCLTLIT